MFNHASYFFPPTKNPYIVKKGSQQTMNVTTMTAIVLAAWKNMDTWNQQQNETYFQKDFTIFGK